jgi:hypothetical protein
MFFHCYAIIFLPFTDFRFIVTPNGWRYNITVVEETIITLNTWHNNKQ